MQPKFVRRFLAASLLTAAFFGTGLPAQAATCRQRIHRAEVRLERAIQRHGRHSVQAERRREDLERARQSCGHPQ
jgi:hypothetical protein